MKTGRSPVILFEQVIGRVFEKFAVISVNPCKKSLRKWLEWADFVAISACFSFESAKFACRRGLPVMCDARQDIGVKVCKWKPVANPPSLSSYVLEMMIQAGK